VKSSVKLQIPKPVGAPPAALVLHKTQVLDANERAHDMAENTEHLLAELARFMEDGVFTEAEYRHTRGHVALGHKLAEEQCSILRWAWTSLTQIEALIATYRGRIQRMKKAALASGLKQSC
jgi:hypothetical protein